MKITTQILCIALTLSGCAQFSAFQNTPGVAQAEQTAIGIGLSLAGASPLYASLAPLAVSGLTYLANKSNPTAVTGQNIPADAALIAQTVSAMIPNNAGTKAASRIAQAYIAAQPTPGTANAVIAAIASGLNAGATAAK